MDEKSGDKTQTADLSNEGNGDGRGVLKDVDYAKLNSSNANEREEELAHIAEQALMFQPKGFTLETTQVLLCVIRSNCLGENSCSISHSWLVKRISNGRIGLASYIVRKESKRNFGR